MDAPLTPFLRILIPGIVAFSFLMEQLDATIITTSVPQIAASLSVLPLQLNVAVTAYVLTLAVFMPLSAYLADRFGAKRIFIAALLMFTLGSGLCGLATSLPMLVATRVVQGLGGAMMTPVGRLILIRSFPRTELVTAMTYTVLPALLGPLLGPLLGGFLTTYLSWRWIFYVNLPFGIVGALLALRYVKDGVRDSGLKFDVTGFLLVGSGLALFQVGMDNVGQPAMPGPMIALTIVAAITLLVAFGFHAFRASHPVMNLRLFGERLFSIGTLAGGICRISLNGTPFLLPLLLQIGFGMSPILSGTLVLFGSVGSLIVRSFIGWFLRRLGFGRILTWITIAGIVTVSGFGLLTATTPLWVLAIYISIFGFIRSMQFLSSNMLSYSEMPDTYLSQATSLFGVFQQLTVSIGVSFSAMLLSLISSHGEHLTRENFAIVFIITGCLGLIGLPFFVMMKPDDGAEVSGFRRVPANAQRA